MSKPKNYSYALQWNWTVLAWQYWYAKKNGDMVDFLPQMSWSEADFGSRKEAFEYAVKDGESVGMVVDPDASYKDDYVKVYTEYDWNNAQKRFYKGGDNALIDIVSALNSQSDMEWELSPSSGTYDMTGQHGNLNHIFAGLTGYFEDGQVDMNVVTYFYLESYPEILKLPLSDEMATWDIGGLDIVFVEFALSGLGDRMTFENLIQAKNKLKSGNWYLVSIAFELENTVSFSDSDPESIADVIILTLKEIVRDVHGDLTSLSGVSFISPDV